MKKNILSHFKIYLRPCFENILFCFKNFTGPFFNFLENEQFLNLVKFCDVNNWKLHKVYMWASPIFKVFISLNHWLCNILLDIKIFWFSKTKKATWIFKRKEMISKARSQINFEVEQNIFFSRLKIIWDLAQIWAKYRRKIDHKV